MKLVLRAGTGQQHPAELLLLAGDDRRHRRRRLPLEHRQLQHSIYHWGDPLVQEPGDKEGPTVQGIDELIARDPGARTGTTPRNTVKNSAFGDRRARASSRFRSTTRTTTTTARRPAASRRCASPTGSASSSSTSATAARSTGASFRSAASATRRGPAARPTCPKRFGSSSSGYMAQLTAQVISYDEEFKRQVARLAARLRRAGRHRRRAIAEGSGPDLVVVDIRSDASSGMAAIERLRATSPSLAHLRGRRSRRARADPPGDAGRRERVLSLERRRGIAGGARDGRVVPRRGAPNGDAARGGVRPATSRPASRTRSSARKAALARRPSR